jgi:hypothetical protein
MPVQPLPSNPNLDRLKGTAKDLRNLVRAGVAGAIETVREHHPRMGSLAPGSSEALGFKLADAQLTLARHHGFASWPKLVRCVEDMRPLRRSPHEQLDRGTGDDGDELIRLACMNYGNDAPRRPAAALALLQSNPNLVSWKVEGVCNSGGHGVVPSLMAWQ